ncbi:hypothetical protein BZM27_44295 [Paraburkholderia steynii]|uniref:Uncharacterized protein n=1 Tax=Paraburkholderia steynii TaxID=1245441 RepID=A0A4R0XB48_9BURK|nr:hypothetical protein BZM27_44295 [Paraburkholderia steynii]
MAKLEKLEIVDHLPWPMRKAASSDGSVRYEQRSAVRVENGTTRTSAGGRQREQRVTKGLMIKHRASGPLRRLHRNTRAGYAG